MVSTGSTVSDHLISLGSNDLIFLFNSVSYKPKVKNSLNQKQNHHFMVSFNSASALCLFSLSFKALNYKTKTDKVNSTWPQGNNCYFCSILLLIYKDQIAFLHI